MAFEELDLDKVENSETDKLASEIETYYKQDMSDKLVRAQVWDENIRFYDGDQHIEYNVNTNRFQQTVVTRNNDFIPRPTTNYISPMVKTIVSQLTKEKPQAKVRANSQDPKDISAARVGDMALDVKHEELREDEKTQEKAYWGVLTGTAFKKIFWNEASNKVIRIPQTDELGNTTYQDLELGDVDTAVIPPFNIAFPFQARSPLEIDWIMEYSVQKIDWIKENYDKSEEGYTGLAKEIKEEKELSAVMQLEYRLRAMTGNKSGGGYTTGTTGALDIKNSSVLKEYYQKPNSKYPKGRMIIVANNKTLFAGDSPYYEGGIDDSWHPYVDWRFEIVPGRCWGKGLVEDIIPLQKRINAIDSLVILNRRTMAIPQWLIPEGSGVPNGYITGRSGLNIPYRPVGANGAKPEKIDATPLSQQVFQERAQVVEDIKRIGMTQDVLQGNNPTGVKTAYQLEQLLENALASLGATFQRWEKSFEREETKKLLLISKRYKEPRIEFGKKLKALNKDITDIDIEMFMGEMLRDNVQVRVEPGSSIPRSKAGENATLRELVQGGILDVIKDTVNKREFLDKMGIKGFDYQSSPDVKRAEWENSIIENGNIDDLVVIPPEQIPPEPQIDPMTGQPMMDNITGMPMMAQGRMTSPQTVLELDDHTAHITIHSARLKNPNVNPEIRKKYLLHIEEHLTFLRSGTEAMSGTGTPEMESKQVNLNQEGAIEQTQGEM